jgi:hypothetical protein
MLGARGSIVVGSLCYKPEGLGFDTLYVRFEVFTLVTIKNAVF